jgi:uroporphyrinogen-III synthase
MIKILYLGLDPRRYRHKGELHHLPLIRIAPRPFEGNIERVFHDLGRYTHLLFTSRTAVSLYLEHALRINVSRTDLREKIYLSIGRATSQKLESGKLPVAYIAEKETGEGVIALLEALLQRTTIQDPPLHLLFPRSAQGRSLIPDYLVQRRIPHTLLDLYDTIPNQVDLPNLEGFDQIVFTSPSTVHAFFAQTRELPVPERCLPLGPVTAQILKKYLTV